MPGRSPIHHRGTRHVAVHLSAHPDNRAGPWKSAVPVATISAEPVPAVEPAVSMPPPSQLGEAVIASSLQGRASGFNDSVLTGASRERYIWHVSNQRQLRFLKHHKTKVQWCRFSPVPERLTRGAPHAPSPAPHSPAPPTDDDAPPLVLVTMAAEIVWWNITYIMKTRINKNFWSNRWNAVTPIESPVDTVKLTTAMDNLHIESAHNNFFFGSGLMNAQECWKCFGKGKLDHPEHIHIMNLMHANTQHLIQGGFIFL
ncbi:PREDICTED: uncharacterized protein LOC106117563 [Papilio xuthus]|uniref:Uncharacterized protein LOC106117563 n=1 Tax=Papilio xuthus TaxID=66420 RepID=A0AAJ6Z8J8_PAPXU|nr:PREDICTED: uncharacterized protein LOC106117563 [Papilio xuthus]